MEAKITICLLFDTSKKEEGMIDRELEGGIYIGGYTKYEYVTFIKETEEILKDYACSACIALPKNYDEADVLEVVKEYYPFEWRILQERYKIYCKADKKLKMLGKKQRYYMSRPEDLLFSLKYTKSLLKEENKEKYRQFYGTNKHKELLEEFISQRNKKIAKIQRKIDRAFERMQRVEPEFLDRLMGLYDSKNTSQKDRVYILLELEKYYCPKVINFFQKKAHSEINFQLREEAVRHLLSLGHYAKLRKQKHMQIHVKNRYKKHKIKNVYANERFNISAIPKELEYRINNSKDQKIKSYDFFISHSSCDHEAVQRLITYLNSVGKNVYCDWINDSDYLKRNLVSDATLNVIEKRLRQSCALLLVVSPNSKKSKWVKYELNYFHEFGKKMKQIQIDSILDGSFQIELLSESDFIDSNFRKIKLYPDISDKKEEIEL